MKTALYKRNSFWLVLALVFALVSAVGASLVQTAGGTVKVDDIKWETASGRSLQRFALHPVNATQRYPQPPAIVVSHGWWNNREMQTPNYVELARRGYVVMSIDMYGQRQL